MQNYNVNNHKQHDESYLEQLLTLRKFAKFSGSNDEDFSIWFDDFNEIIKISNLTEREKIIKLKTFQVSVRIQSILYRKPVVK